MGQTLNAIEPKPLSNLFSGLSQM
uniref:Uncharacterized protein n=1 Tax=Arundo donax TaxID=35708 RepID=A0A0A8ZG76_ARUDO